MPLSELVQVKSPRIIQVINNLRSIFTAIIIIIFLTLHVLVSPGMALVASIPRHRVLWHGYCSVPTHRCLAMTSSSLELEVEQKFTLGSSSEEKAKIEKRLTDLGFEVLIVPHHETHVAGMVDWYWDDAANRGNKWPLTSQDCWLRYRRQGNRAAWQLKLRPQNDKTTATAAAAATVYEEICGTDALVKAIALLPRDAISTSTKGKPQQQALLLLDLFRQEFQQDLPKELLDGSGDKTPLLLPFARIETKRSTWIPSNTTDPHYATLRVDLDTAIYDNKDDVYAVGEVEEVVHTADEIPQARRRVQQFVEQLIGVADATAGPSLPVVGKLEHYLIRNQPEHYQALIDHGILRQYNLN
jgi:hypothetical protein